MKAFVRRITWALAFVTALPALAHADAMTDEQVKLCVNEARAVSVDQQIFACTSAILSGKWSGKNLSWAYVNRVMAYALKGKLEKALADANEAVRLDPQNAMAFTNRGFVYEFNQPLVVQDGGFRAHVRFGNGGADHVETVECRLGRDAVHIDAKGKDAVLDIEIEVLANLVFVEDLAGADADLVPPGEPSAGSHGCDLLQLALSRRNQVPSLGRAQLGKLWVAAGHQPLAGIVFARKAERWRRF